MRVCRAKQILPYRNRVARKTFSERWVASPILQRSGLGMPRDRGWERQVRRSFDSQINDTGTRRYGSAVYQSTNGVMWVRAALLSPEYREHPISNHLGGSWWHSGARKS